MKNFLAVLILVVLGFTGCSPIVLDTSTNTQISKSAFYEDLAKADVVVIGEWHDQYKHHFWEIDIIKALLKKGHRCVLLEVLPEKNDMNREKKRIKEALDWDDRWPFEDYSHLAKYLHENVTCVGGVSLSTQELAVIRQGAKPLVGEYSATDEVKDTIKEAIKASRGELGGKRLRERDLEYFATAQMYEDRRAADLALKRSPSILIMGRERADKISGVPLHIMDFLKASNKDAIIKTVLLGAADPDRADYILR